MTSAFITIWLQPGFSYQSNVHMLVAYKYIYKSLSETAKSNFKNTSIQQKEVSLKLPFAVSLCDLFITIQYAVFRKSFIYDIVSKLPLSGTH